MELKFYKYHGTGNDFILVDDRERKISLSSQQIAFLCHRHFGIGADGLMLLQLEEGYDFRMVYYNSDGGESSMCGNGGRCITAFAKRLGIIFDHASFIAIDGPHAATIDANDFVSLDMIDVNEIEHSDDHSLLNTGSPHYVLWTNDVKHKDVFADGRLIRNQNEFQPKGINVNFAEKTGDGISVRTYERGVEAETLSCGTGVTAAAIASTRNKTGSFSIDIETPGGKLNVRFKKETEHKAIDVILSGPAVFVYEGTIRM